MYQPCRPDIHTHAGRDLDLNFQRLAPGRHRCTQGETASRLASCWVCVPPRAKTCPQCKPFMFLSTNGSARGYGGEAAKLVSRIQRFDGGWLGRPAAASGGRLPRLSPKVLWDCYVVLCGRGVCCSLFFGHCWHHCSSPSCVFAQGWDRDKIEKCAVQYDWTPCQFIEYKQATKICQNTKLDNFILLLLAHILFLLSPALTFVHPRSLGRWADFTLGN